MKSLIFTLIALTTSFAFAQDKLHNNHCIPRLDSKRYISADFTAAYPRTVKFECTYECQANGKVDLITGALNVRVSNIEEDARDVVCQGVKVKKVPWGYDFDGIEAFYAFDTSIKEIKAYAFVNVNRNNLRERELLTKLQESLLKVAGSYQTTGVAAFTDAAKILTDVALELPASTKLLDKYTALILANNGQITLGANSESLVLSSISALAAWRMPIHLYKK